jgi:hypothetical protein
VSKLAPAAKMLYAGGELTDFKGRRGAAEVQVARREDRRLIGVNYLLSAK